MSVGELIKKLRKERKLTQQQLADSVATDIRRISFYENDKMVPSTEVLMRLANFFNVSTDYLLEGEPEGIRKVFFIDQPLFSLFQQADRLPQKDREVLKEVIRAFIFKNKIKDLSEFEEDRF